MPNWCHNKLAVTGDPEAVKAFIAKVEADDADGEGRNAISFAVHVPEPENVDEYIPPADSLWGRLGELGWYAWRLVHWGTKWDASCHGVHGLLVLSRAAEQREGDAAWIMVDDTAAISFETAWSPPETWLRAVAQQESHLSFVLRWAEVGSGAAGEIRAHGDTFSHEGLEVDEVLADEELWF